MKHFFERYQDQHQGQRSYTWVKSRLQESGLTPRHKRRSNRANDAHGAPLAGMMIHQDGSTHEWVPGQVWDLIVTMDDATSEIYSAFFVEEEGTLSSFQGVRDTLLKKGLFSSFYSDRGSHYWVTSEAGNKVDKHRLTQFGPCHEPIGYSDDSGLLSRGRGRSERFFRTLQDRLPKELALANITTMEAANRLLSRSYIKRFNAKFMVEPTEPDSAFVPLMGVDIDNILCRQVERQVSKDHCVSYQGVTPSVTSGAALSAPGSKESPGARIPGRESGDLPRTAVSGTVHG